MLKKEEWSRVREEYDAHDLPSTPCVIWYSPEVPIALNDQFAVFIACVVHS